MTHIKVCGITTLEDAQMCIDLGVTLLGLNFYSSSPRYLDPVKARGVCDALRSQYGDHTPVMVGVFVNASSEEMLAIADEVGLDALQLSGDEPVAALDEFGLRAYKAIRPSSVQEAEIHLTIFPRDLPPYLPEILLDAFHPALYGGTGHTASDEIVQVARNRGLRWMLAGGLTPENVGSRVLAHQPWGVDVASGVEDGQPGRKSLEKVRAFVAAVRAHEKV